jgi:hypothetical protein
MLLFEMFTSSEDWPLTVFAESRIEAEVFYAHWARLNRPAWPDEAVSVFQYDGRELLGNMPVYEAAYKELPGIGVWDPDANEWVVRSPEEAGDQHLVRPATHVRYFRVSDGDMELMVFAQSFAQAVGYFSHWYCHTNGYPEETIVITEHPRWRLVLALAELREGMENGNQGVARWDVDRRWEIVAPAYGTIMPKQLR